MTQTIPTGSAKLLGKTDREIDRHLLSTGAQKLVQLAGLPANWDGYNSPPIAPPVLNVASALLLHIGIDPYDVAPISGGMVGLEWRRADDRIQLWIGERVGWVMVKHRDGRRIASEGDTASADEAKAMVLEIMGDGP